ncbi:hypothetical protein B0T20DRAFT_456549 [Sordaria brevicollis]|uniref:Uncharacterized protein n=1 Tax=Sordaria brevicollis TaxID=83679 RepID=A0AAE0P0X8_SORBR|nr:hypothetical protein B0T20DRAFT_456549 [Sordaria brevicollis]
MDNMMKELVAKTDPLLGYSSLPVTFTSVLLPKYNNELHRYWFVASRIAEAQFGVSLPDPLNPSATETDEQARAAKKIREWYLEGMEDVMMRLYKLGYSRVSAATHRYALDFSLWLRAYTFYVGCGNYSPQFLYDIPLDYIVPFSKEYDDFYRHQKALECPLISLADTITAGSITLPREVPQEAHPEPNARTTATSMMPQDGPEQVPLQLIGSAVKTGSMPSNRRVTVADVDKVLREKIEKARSEKAKANLLELSQRGLASTGLLGRNDVRQRSLDKQQSQAPTTTHATQITNQGQADRPQSSVQPPRKSDHPAAPVLLCGNRACQTVGHELVDCFGPPTALGDIVGCPFCNTEAHILDCCPQLPYVTKDTLFDMLVTRRANLPVIRTSISILSLAVSLNKLPTLARAMPLTKPTVKGPYTELRSWRCRDRSLIFRDPTMPTDPVEFLEELDKEWPHVVIQTTHTYGSIGSIPPKRTLTIFAVEWISLLVPYRKIFKRAQVHVDGRGHYPFVEDARTYERNQKEQVKYLIVALRKEAEKRGRSAAARQSRR